MERYWRTQAAARARVDWERDPDGLGNVCHAGVPAYLNEHYARGQRAVFQTFLSSLELRVGMRALDVGCGAGRWSRLLLERGLAVTGIDLQPDLIERSRARYPQATFECCSIQEFQPDGPFDIASCVTVLMHVPFDEQPRAARAIRDALVAGGHLLLLESLREQGPSAFSHSPARWKRLLGDCGFRLVAFRRYDYNPGLRAVSWARRRSHLAFLPRDQVPEGASEFGRLPERSYLLGGLRRVGKRCLPLAQRAAVAMDARIEPLLIRHNPTFGSVYAGFLLEAE
jgi:SAM-dependent methyltransferase